ncbi:MAG: aminopeptidase P N-terminal domain-containing protein [Xanthomonadales bacterium]|nr:aminopeptidase P N-terminal domain-containing protein [Xanthomonadales bacterium]MDH3941453.1 aminopeptidase P N-terminal domain-containing protein [Xanthomonadales bacterium]MDH4002132.1 aminopeptidase P N-terminal domain-containing protein [Xanthomonadales bacterium]
MIKHKEYARRRRQLMRMAGEESLVILQAAPARLRNNDVYFPYRQDSDFLYLTGFREPDALLVLLPEEKDGRSILFCRERDPEREMWDGRMVGLEAAVSEYGMDEAYDISEADERLRDLLRDMDRIYYDLGRDPLFDQKLIGWLNTIRGQARKTFHAPEEIHALDHMLHDMRVYKSREELSVMRRSAKVAIEAHQHAMQVCEPGLNEADIHACLAHTFTRHQCEPSYLPIVGGGANACILHYIANNQLLNDGDLLLIDAGAEYDGYASDITRTFPVNGKFSSEQRALYDVVLAAQQAAINEARAGEQWQDVHDAAIHVATEGMIELGILEGTVEEQLETKGYKRFYIHNTGHWLGLDVHDVGEYTIDGHSRELEPGMVMTIEPGIYIGPEEESVKPCWRGVGIRIEDNIAITQDKPRILTDGLARTPDEVEALMAG